MSPSANDASDADGATNAKARRAAAAAAPTGRAPERSLWAIASLLCSLAVCPPFCVIGPVLGIFALFELRYRPHRSGRGVARAGIALGLVFTIGWSAAGWWWNANVRRPILDGPSAALAAGAGGDPAAFVAQFVTPSAGGGAVDAEAEAAGFLEELERRYGAFRSVRMRMPDEADDASALDGTGDGTGGETGDETGGETGDETGGEPAPTAESVDPARVIVPYDFVFERETVPGFAEFVITEEHRLPMILRWRWIRLEDPVRGDLAYPVTAAARDETPSGRPP